MDSFTKSRAMGVQNLLDLTHHEKYITLYFIDVLPRG